MKEIPLTQGQFAIVDDCDFEWLSQWKWHANGNGYATRMEGTSRTDRRAVFMARVIMGCIPGDGFKVDHRDENTLNNQRYNLRKCSNAQNLQNNGTRSDNTSGYKGVSWDKSKRKWSAKINAYGKVHFLGRYDDILDAARAYDEGAIKYHGEFARFNLPHTSAE